MAVRFGYIYGAISSNLCVAMNKFEHHNQNRCVLWIGDRHSGKTTAAAKLIGDLRHQGYTIGGILAPSIYEHEQLIGFDIVDIRNYYRAPLAVHDSNICGTVPYRYYQQGLKLGHSALSPAENKTVDLVIVDEYGPLELNGEGWRRDVDTLLKKSSLPILLVVRRNIADKVRRLYSEYICFSLEALDSNSINRMLVWLKE